MEMLIAKARVMFQISRTAPYAYCKYQASRISLAIGMLTRQDLLAYLLAYNTKTVFPNLSIRKDIQSIGADFMLREKKVGYEIRYVSTREVGCASHEPSAGDSEI